MTDITNINDYRTPQKQPLEEYEVPRAMCLRTAAEKARISPVETPRRMPELPGPHIAKSFIHKHPTL